VDQVFKTIESCDCKDNEQEEWRTLEIEAGANNTELQVTELMAGMRKGPIQVTDGQVTTEFGRSFDELLKLGPGLHRICNCRIIGRKDAVSKARRE